MKAKNVFDSYEIIARVCPALIISLPIIITCYSISALFDASVAIKIAIDSPIIIAILVLLSSIVRHFGREIEPKIWHIWGGAPSTRFLRKADSHFAQETKKKLYQKILEDTEIDLEKNNSDEKINQAYAFIRNKLRDKKNKGLWVRFNQEYGFYRNLMGSRWAWILLAFVSSFGSFIVYAKSTNKPDLLWIGSLVNFVIGLVAIGCAWYILPRLTKGVAERYAEDALISYLNLE